MAAPVVEWDEEQVSQLASLWRAGYACKDIAAKIGAGATKNAIIGKVRRMREKGFKLEPRQSGTPRSQLQRQPAPAQPRMPKPHARVPAAPKPPVKAMVVPSDAPTPLHLTMMQLTAGTCRWPAEGTGAAMTFCGCQVAEGHPYCAFHYRRSIIHGSAIAAKKRGSK